MFVIAVQDVLKRLRLIDDRVINALNSSLPTESFKEKKNSEEQCKEFCDQVSFFCDVYLWHSVVACHVVGTCLFLRCSENSCALIHTVRFLGRNSDVIARLR